MRNLLTKWAVMGFLFSAWAFAVERPPNREAEIRAAILAAYPGAEIGLPEGIDPRIHSASDISYTGDSGTGVAYFLVDGRQVKVTYNAYVNGLAAVRKISPMERLERSAFLIQKVDLSRPENRLLRGLVVAPTAALSDYESAQTLLPGTILTGPMAKRAPLVRRGDTVELRITSGGVTLTTGAVAQEPALEGDRIHVLTRQSKRDFTGKLVSKNTVEVSL